MCPLPPPLNDCKHFTTSCLVLQKHHTGLCVLSVLLLRLLKVQSGFVQSSSNGASWASKRRHPQSGACKRQRVLLIHQPSSAPDVSRPRLAFLGCVVIQRIPISHQSSDWGGNLLIISQTHTSAAFTFVNRGRCRTPKILIHYDL